VRDAVRGAVTRGTPGAGVPVPCRAGGAGAGGPCSPRGGGAHGGSGGFASFAPPYLWRYSWAPRGLNPRGGVAMPQMGEPLGWGDPWTGGGVAWQTGGEGRSEQPSPHRARLLRLRAGPRNFGAGGTGCEGRNIGAGFAPHGWLRSRGAGPRPVEVVGESHARVSQRCSPLVFS